MYVLLNVTLGGGLHLLRFMRATHWKMATSLFIHILLMFHVLFVEEYVQILKPVNAY